MLVTFAFSWTVWALGFVAFRGTAAGFVSVVLGGFGPPLGAVVVRRTRGEPVVSWLRERLRVRGVAPRWFLLALAVPLAFTVVQTAAFAADGATLSPSLVLARLPAYLGSLVFVFLAGGGQEEFGWRGLMLPRIQAPRGPYVASLAVGVVWALWHLPLYVLPGAIYASRPFASYVFVPIAFSFVLTWLYNRSGRALLVVMLLHAGVNSAGALIPAPASLLSSTAVVTQYQLVEAGAALLVLAVVLAVSGREALDFRGDGESTAG